MQITNQTADALFRVLCKHLTCEQVMAIVKDLMEVPGNSSLKYSLQVLAGLPIREDTNTYTIWDYPAFAFFVWKTEDGTVGACMAPRDMTERREAHKVFKARADIVDSGWLLACSVEDAIEKFTDLTTH